MHKCEKCLAVFTTKQNLNKHINKKIPCDSIIQCENCLVIFKTRQILNNHINKKNKCIKVELKIENIKLKQKIVKIINEFSISVENEMYKLELSKIKKIIELLNQNIINEKYIMNQIL